MIFFAVVFSVMIFTQTTPAKLSVSPNINFDDDHDIHTNTKNVKVPAEDTPTPPKIPVVNRYRHIPPYSEQGNETDSAGITSTSVSEESMTTTTQEPDVQVSDKIAVTKTTLPSASTSDEDTRKLRDDEGTELCKNEQSTMALGEEKMIATTEKNGADLSETTLTNGVIEGITEKPALSAMRDNTNTERSDATISVEDSGSIQSSLEKPTEAQSYSTGNTQMTGLSEESNDRMKNTVTQTAVPELKELKSTTDLNIDSIYLHNDLLERSDVGTEKEPMGMTKTPESKKLANDVTTTNVEKPVEQQLQTSDPTEATVCSQATTDMESDVPSSALLCDSRIFVVVAMIFHIFFTFHRNEH